MRRAASILLSILLGASAVGIGMAFFLKQANTDRLRLAEVASKAQTEANAARDLMQKTVENANKQLDVANKEITTAQQMITALHEEQKLLPIATHLSPPPPRVLKTWTQNVNATVGVAFRHPSWVNAPLSAHTPFNIGVYREHAYTDVLASLTTSLTRIYVVKGRILEGVHGTGPGGKPITVLRVRRDGKITHLLWSELDEKITEQILATLDFKE